MAEMTMAQHESKVAEGFCVDLKKDPNTIAHDLRLGGSVSLGSNLGRAKTLLAMQAPLIQEHHPSGYVRVM